MGRHQVDEELKGFWEIRLARPVFKSSQNIPAASHPGGILYELGLPSVHSSWWLLRALNQANRTLASRGDAKADISFPFA